ncbi:DUF262 domain-containing protein [Actinomyces sp. ICM47]|uniref:DUF262 domain-containing protein n=1 Tax=Actinomyces sp. ICM47 TaxID=936548 RepID=UPI0025C0412B|nr:DUF262 domain-containing protein [Actinomyces sp. ICM47]
MSSEAMQPKHETFRLSELRDLVATGRVRIPDFQRSFRWTNQDVVALFDSLHHGYPIGNLLMWKREAPAQRLTVGSIDIDAPQRPDALWLVDGQQRVTSIINAMDAGSQRDARFAVGYDLENACVVSTLGRHSRAVMPLFRLFDFVSAWQWFEENTEFQALRGRYQEAFNTFNAVSVPATVLEGADEDKLRVIFDRINQSGKKLKSFEVFEALNSSVSDGRTLRSISDAVARSTNFGLLSEDQVLNVLKARRNPDYMRDVRDEFGDERRKNSDFPDEDRDEAYAQTEFVLKRATRFLQDNCCIPHVTLLPYSAILVVVSRFFALFPEPKRRNKELLKRWVWRTIVKTIEGTISSGNVQTRTFLKSVRRGDESDSVQGLLESVGERVTADRIAIPTARMNRSDAKACVCAMWSHYMRSEDCTGQALTALFDSLVGDYGSAADLLVDYVGHDRMGEDSGGSYSSLANRILLVNEDARQDEDALRAFMTAHLDMLMLPEGTEESEHQMDPEELISRREEVVSARVNEFFDSMMAWDYVAFAPVELT